ncbi:hypothetical protein SVI_3735 [Shewanella violacea DSS12]|uniref:PIG-L family deacetylase n=1 Tax=Shewanella violacea (strain JCM 10179 / CIP 106290 / LMG 19151 / DSS12) TaxID=637905 RepID=D4ZCG1_SHEVD|nr:hypothetical protein SVI_3735 [Shewanella violacea DSS12]
MLFLVILLCSCHLIEENNITKPRAILVLLAHPDDETWVSGTLAKLAANGFKVIPVYATSGDRGTDHSGKNLSGDALAKVREAEAVAACEVLGLEAPIFLRFADGSLALQSQRLVKEIQAMVEEIRPVAVLSFGPGGVTGNRDHIAVSTLVSQYFPMQAVYFAVSDTQAENLTASALKFGLDYRVAAPIPDQEVRVRVQLDDFAAVRALAMAKHVTQFPPVMINAFADYIESAVVEELVIPEVTQVSSEFVELLKR